MKENRSQVDKLIVARTIFQLVNTLSNFQDKYSATAALILLQDASDINAWWQTLFERFEILHGNDPIFDGKNWVSY